MKIVWIALAWALCLGGLIAAVGAPLHYGGPTELAIIVVSGTISTFFGVVALAHTLRLM